MHWLKGGAILGIALFSTTFAQDNMSPPKEMPSSTFEIKTGYFFFASQTMRNVYNYGGFQIQTCGSYTILKHLQLYGSIGFLEAWGKSLHFHQKTALWQIPVDLGLKPVLSLSPSVQWYAALGPRYFYLYQDNQSSSVNSYVKNGIGMFVNTGFHFFPANHLLVDLFGEYSYEPVHSSSWKSGVHGRSVQVGGFSFGAGLGYTF